MPFTWPWMEPEPSSCRSAAEPIRGGRLPSERDPLRLPPSRRCSRVAPSSLDRRVKPGGINEFYAAAKQPEDRSCCFRGRLGSAPLLLRQDPLKWPKNIPDMWRNYRCFRIEEQCSNRLKNNKLWQHLDRENAPVSKKNRGKQGITGGDGFAADCLVSQGVGLKSLRICSFLARRNSLETSAR